jgi:hypothetical protein
LGLSESDTGTKLIDPAIHARGRTEDLIKREETAGPLLVILDRKAKSSRATRHRFSWRYGRQINTSAPIAACQSAPKKEGEPMFEANVDFSGAIEYLDEIQEALKTVAGDLGQVKINDVTSENDVAQAVTELEGIVDRAFARFVHNPTVRGMAEQMKTSYKEQMLQKVEEKRREIMRRRETEAHGQFYLKTAHHCSQRVLRSGGNAKRGTRRAEGSEIADGAEQYFAAFHYVGNPRKQPHS